MKSDGSSQALMYEELAMTTGWSDMLLWLTLQFFKLNLTLHLLKFKYKQNAMKANLHPI